MLDLFQIYSIIVRWFKEVDFLFFLDFYKVFNAIEHPFILKTLKHFGFGLRFINLN